MSDNNTDDRQELLERFIKEISSGTGSVFYDEDELIELYDYASDIGNDYVRFEVLMCGSRLYPSSVALGERKAFFFYMEDNEEAARAALAVLPDTSVLKQLLTLLVNHLPKDLAAKELDRILASVKEFEDEEVIRLVHTACILGAYTWLTDNYQAILSRCSYPQSFVFELMNEANVRGDYEVVAKLSEELTLLEPFNGEFWESLAEVHITHLNKFETGLSYLDYALAINPDSVPALLLKARALHELDKPVEEIMQVLAKAMELEPDNVTPVQYMALSLYAKGYKGEAVKVLEDYLEIHPGSIDAVESLLLMSDGKIKPGTLEPFFEDVSEDDEKLYKPKQLFLDMAKGFVTDREYGSALAILDFYDRKLGIKDESELLFELLYRNRKYDDIVTRWQTLPSQFRTHITDLIFILSCFRINRIALVKKHIHEMLERSGAPWKEETYAETMSRLGSLYMFTLITQTFEENGIFNIDECDPFNPLS